MTFSYSPEDQFPQHHSWLAAAYIKAWLKILMHAPWRHQNKTHLSPNDQHDGAPFRSRPDNAVITLLTDTEIEEFSFAMRSIVQYPVASEQMRIFVEELVYGPQYEKFWS